MLWFTNSVTYPLLLGVGNAFDGLGIFAGGYVAHLFTEVFALDRAAQDF